MSLVNKAISLGRNRIIMNSYWDFHERKQNWFFSPNPRLAGATRKPNTFSTWKHWNSLSSSQKSTISTLAEFHYTASDVKKNDDHLKRLIKAYGKWNSNLYSVFWSNTGSQKIWLCNVFVGDAIYLYNKKSFTGANRHYYDPRQILSGQTSLKKRASHKDVQPGDIVVFGKGHVEIVTSLADHWFADDGFCSIGAGRGDSYDNNGNGQIKCDPSGMDRYESRELENTNNTYFYL